MIIVTGGAGFIGSAVIWELNRQGEDDILVVDNLASTEKWKNLVGLRYREYVHRDAFIQQVRAKAFPLGVRGIIHMGACSSTTELNADFLMENNLHYTRDLCSVALEHGIRFINASSAATYGDGSLGFSSPLALLPKFAPLNMYGYTKHLFDLWLLRNNLLNSVASLKFFNVYGPNEYHKDSMRSVICKAVPQILENGVLRLFKSDHPDYADGGQMRDFVYVKDCAALVVKLLQTPALNGIFNVGTGQARSWNHLAQAVFDALGKPCNIEYMDMPKVLKGKYQYFTQADMSWLEEKHVSFAFTSLEEGASDYVRNYLTQNNSYL